MRAMRKGFRIAQLLMVSITIVACGGGYGETYSSTASASAATSGVTVGTITGFGSVHLNGMKFETTSTSIDVDGRPGVQSDLHVGDVIEVKGHHDGATGKDIAEQIEFRSNVQGPLSAIDPVAKTLIVLGQTIVVSADTSFDDAISPASLAGLTVGDILRVSGMPTADGRIHATRIEREPAGSGFQVIGVAASTDAMAKTLRISALLVDFSTATLVDFPSTGPKDGDLIEAVGTTLASSGALQATQMELRTGKGLKADVDSESEIEGLITRFGSSTDFDVAGHPVKTSSSTTFKGGTASDLALNVSVEVEGSTDTSGVLSATKVSIGHAANTRLVGQVVDSVNAGAGTVVLLGIQVAVDSMTRFEDHGSQKIETFSLADLHSGDWLEIRGTQATGSDSVSAMRIDRVQTQSSVQLTGAVASAAQPGFTMLSVTVATTTSTHFDNGLTATTFFAAPVGKMISVQGSWNGTTLTADKIKAAENDDID
jgi:hypothetical protein